MWGANSDLDSCNATLLRLLRKDLHPSHSLNHFSSTIHPREPEKPCKRAILKELASYLLSSSTGRL